MRIKVVEKATHKMEVAFKAGQISRYYIYGDNIALKDEHYYTSRNKDGAEYESVEDGLTFLLSHKFLWKFRHLDGTTIIRTSDISSIFIESITPISNPLCGDDHYDDPTN